MDTATAAPHIYDVQAWNPANTTRYAYSTTSGQEGCVVLPGAQVEFRFKIDSKLYYTGGSTNPASMHDKESKGDKDAVYTINYNVVTTQLD